MISVLLRTFWTDNLVSAIATCLALWSVDTTAQTLTRGPYLQMGTATSQTVRWRTDMATDSQLQIGLNPAALNQGTNVSSLTTEHIVTVSGLLPATRYYYSVGSSLTPIAGVDTEHFFVTAPVKAAMDPFRVWVLGDAGTAGPTGVNANQSAVRDAYASFNGTQYTNLILMLGDNAYNTGTDAEYQRAVFNMYGSFLNKSNLWSTIGNHETAQATTIDVNRIPYFNIFTFPSNGEAGGLASGTEKYYSFNIGNVHFVCLDSMTSNRSPTGAMLTWLNADLAANDQTWVVAFWHHPPYTKGSHDSDTETQLVEMRENALPILESHGVDLVLSGHSHSYERSYLIGGHYGNSSSWNPEKMLKNGGNGQADGTGAYVKNSRNPRRAVYAVTGSSGQTSGGSLNHPAMFVSLNKLGSMVLDINGNRLDAKFIRETGVVADSFSIIKTNNGKLIPSLTLLIE